MLPSVTRRYRDWSDRRSFSFSFHCDRCGGSWKSAPLPFSRGEDEESADRDLVWQIEYYFAYERANTEAALHFNRCPACGRRVCDACFDEPTGRCLDCSKERKPDDKKGATP